MHQRLSLPFGPPDNVLHKKPPNLPAAHGRDFLLDNSLFFRGKETDEGQQINLRVGGEPKQTAAAEETKKKRKQKLD